VELSIINTQAIRGHNVMNKAELINSVAEATKLSHADADRAVQAVLQSISGALSRGDQVVLVGFGTFTVKQRAARTGRNPQTGQTIQIAASRVPGFKAGKALKDAVN
jgi:DNA-binding protein HU-beta